MGYWKSAKRDTEGVARMNRAEEETAQSDCKNNRRRTEFETFEDLESYRNIVRIRKPKQLGSMPYKEHLSFPNFRRGEFLVSVPNSTIPCFH